MFSRLVPNLREIGLLSPRIQQRYEQVGLMRYFDGAAADQLSGSQFIAQLDDTPTVVDQATGADSALTTLSPQRPHGASAALPKLQ